MQRKVVEGSERIFFISDYAAKCCVPLKKVFGKNFVQGKVVKVDVDNKCVELDGGKVIRYKTLVLATGSRSFMPFKSNGDVTTIKEYIEKVNQVNAEVCRSRNSGVILARIKSPVYRMGQK